MKKTVLEKAFVRATKAIDRSVKTSAFNLWVECKGGYLSFAGISTGFQILSRIPLEKEKETLQEFSGKILEGRFGSILKSIHEDVDLTLSYADNQLIMKSESLTVKVPVAQEDYAFPVDLNAWTSNPKYVYSSDKIGEYVRDVSHAASQSAVEKGEYSTGQALEFFRSGVRVLCSSSKGTSVRSNVLDEDHKPMFELVIPAVLLTEAVSLFGEAISFAIHDEDLVVLYDESKTLFVQLQRMSMKYPDLDILTRQFKSNVYAFVSSKDILQGIALCQAVSSSFMELHIAEHAVVFKVKTIDGDSCYTATAQTNVREPHSLKMKVNSQRLLAAVKSMDGGLIALEFTDVHSLFRLRDRSSSLEYLLPYCR